MSLLAGLSQQGDSISAHNQAWSTITNTPTTLSGYGITDAQPLDSDLTALAGLSTTGIVASTGDGTAATRTITGTTNQVIVSNGDGVAGNPTLSLPQGISITSSPAFYGLSIGVGGISCTGSEALRIKNDSGYVSFWNSANTTRTGSIQGNAGNELRLVAEGTAKLYFSVGGVVRAAFDTTGAFRLTSYGAGTLVTDSSGNVTASSDASLKTVTGSFTRGLDDILKLTPRTYHWNEKSGMNTEDENVGFIAQEVLESIPEAVGQYRTSEDEVDGKKTKKREKAELLTLSDRPLIAALVNAVKELKSENDELRNRIDKLGAKK